MATRLLVLFSREPRRQADEKGLRGRAGEHLFTAFALGWLDAARRVEARLAVAAPRADHAGWRRSLSGEEIALLEQRGSSFGRRLEDAARQAGELGGHAVLVGGDVAPAPEILAKAFDLLEKGADAVLAPAPDGGVSLVALPAADLDLLRGLAPRRFDVFSRLSKSLRARGRLVRVVAPAPDVDGRRQLGRLLRRPLWTPDLKALARDALKSKTWSPSVAALPVPSRPHFDPEASRAPPSGS